jgi:hypothetical protein
VFSQGGIGEKGAEGTAGNDGARVSETLASWARILYWACLMNLWTCFNFSK